MAKYWVIIFISVVIALSGCTVKDKLQWADDKAGQVFEKLEEGEASTTTPEIEDISTSTEKSTLGGEVKAEDLSTEQKDKIDNWLKENSFNRYGDPIETMYTGGTPLFNEATGESIERFEYVLKKLPDILEKIK